MRIEKRNRLMIKWGLISFDESTPHKKDGWFWMDARGDEHVDTGVGREHYPRSAQWTSAKPSGF